MKERPILFRAPMVRAILDGSKTQTRRIVKPDPGPYWNPVVGPYNPTVIKNGGYEAPGPEIFGASDESLGRKFPYGEPGHHLWVREAWSIEALGAFGTPEGYDSTYELQYKAGGDEREIHVAPGEPDPYIKLYDSQRGDWRPSIHMPRWASRILLEIVSVRVERLQDISEGDCRAEGIDACDGIGTTASILALAERMGEGATEARLRYATLWESINGADSWDANPWVWVIEFRRVAP